MHFHKPELLYALLALLIPILVHLFQLRRFQKESFTNVAFLKQIKLQTRRSANLKKWLILVSRILAIACIVMAFSQPFIPNSIKNIQPPELVIYLDNSFSMQAKDQNGTLLNGAVQEILNQKFPTPYISLFTNSKTYKKRSADDLKKELLDVQYTHQQLDYESIIGKTYLLFSDNPFTEKYLIIISDFQQQNIQNFKTKKNSNVKLTLVQKSAISNSNAFIKSVEISQQMEDNILNVFGGTSNFNQDSIPISLFNNDLLIGKSILAKSNNFSATFTISKTNSTIGKITIDDSGPNFDNNFYFNLPKTSKTKVLAIGNTPSIFLNRIFTEDEFLFEFSTQNELDYNDLQNQDLVILDEIKFISKALQVSLNTFFENGGTVLFIPSSEGSLDHYNEVLSLKNLKFNSINSHTKKITKIYFDHPIYEQTFEQKVTNFQYPKVETYFSLDKPTKPLLGLDDGTPFLVEKEGLFVFSASLNESNCNFTASPLVVPTIYGIGKSSVRTPKLYYTIGQKNELDLDYSLKNDAVLNLSNSENSFIPFQTMKNKKLKIYFEDIPNTSGHYNLNSNNETVHLLSFNYDEKESQISSVSNNELDLGKAIKSIESAFEFINNEVNIKELWKWFVIFALLFFLLEILLLKFLR